MHNRRLFLSGSAATVLAPIVVAPGVAKAQTSLKTYRAADLVDSVGVCTHLSYSSSVYAKKFDAILPLIVDSKIKHLREEVYVKNNIAYSAPFYQRCRSLAEAGVKFCCIAARLVQYPTEADYYGLETAYKNMNGSIEHFEGVNEPNYASFSTWPAVSAQMQMLLYTAVGNARELTGVTVVAPSYTGSSGRNVGDISAYADIGNVHSYPGGAHPETTGTGALNTYVSSARLVTLQKPVMATETGYHSAMTTTKAHAPTPIPIIARYLPRMLVFQFMSGLKRTYLYQFADSTALGDSDQESNFGLVDANAVPKASYWAVRNLMTIFSEEKPVSEVTPLDLTVSGGTNVQAAAFQRGDGDYLVTVWRGVSGYNPSSRTVLTVASETVQLSALQPLTLVDVRTLTDTGEVVTDADGRQGTSFDLTIDGSMRIARFRR
ncbi:MAG: hypothetical protein QM608_18220 [Caulobacter sp.]